MQKVIARVTLQSALLSLCSALVATFLTPKNPPIVALVVFSLLATPPNFLWQQYLERKFPGYRVEKQESNVEIKGAQSAGGGVTIKKKLNVQNTLMKMGIEQTLGSVVNVALHLGIVQALQGVPLSECLQVVKTDSGWKLGQPGMGDLSGIEIRNMSGGSLYADRRLLAGAQDSRGGASVGLREA
ncbi:MAG: hypothetical protein LQ337_006692 [Flavoplaca oasis]|nr:MAG: hypothetical protein LQ337_006692 [Flavoplaca oasis]